VLPRAWFVTADAPPMGAVVPGLGMASWDRLKNDDAFPRVPFSSGEIVIENVDSDGSLTVVEHYKNTGPARYCPWLLDGHATLTVARWSMESHTPLTTRM